MVRATCPKSFGKRWKMGRSWVSQYCSLSHILAHSPAFSGAPPQLHFPSFLLFAPPPPPAPFYWPFLVSTICVVFEHFPRYSPSSVSLALDIRVIFGFMSWCCDGTCLGVFGILQHDPVHGLRLVDSPIDGLTLPRRVVVEAVRVIAVG